MLEPTAVDVGREVSRETRRRAAIASTLTSAAAVRTCLPSRAVSLAASRST